MQHSIENSPAFSTLNLEFNAGESLTTQPGSMLAMTTGFGMEAKLGSQMSGGRAAGRAVRSLFAGESFFAAVYTAKRDGEKLILAPAHPGEIRALDVAEGSPWLIASGGFLACTSEVKLELKYVGVRGWISSHGLFLMRTSGLGLIFVSSHGALIEKELAAGERFVVDNRHIIAFSETIKYEMVTVATSVRHSIFSGEGLVNRYTGPGRVLFQTRGAQGPGMVRGLLNMVT